MTHTTHTGHYETSTNGLQQEGEYMLPSEEKQEEDTAQVTNEVSEVQSEKQQRGCTKSLMDWMSRMVPPGGLLSTVFNLSSACVGAGILGLPAAANSSGPVMAVIIPAVIALLTVYSLYCLAVQMHRHGLKTYESMARAILGSGFDYTTAALRSLNTFGACVAFIISVGDIFTAIIDNADGPEYWKSRSGIRLLTTLLWLVVMLPLVIPRHINTLRYVSTVGVAFVIYFVVMLIVHSCMNGLSDNVKNIHVTGTPTDEGIHLFGTGNKAISGLGMFLFSFLCQVSSFEIFWDMGERNVNRFTLYCAISMVLCFLLYTASAVFGYLDFGSLATVSALRLYNPLKEVAVMVAYIGVLVKLCASYTILSMATRNALYHTVGWDPDTLVFWKHCIVVICLAGAALLCGLFIPNINLVFGFIGGVCGGVLAFIFPAIFMMYGGNWSLRSVGMGHYICTYILLFAGVVMVVFGTGSTIYDAVTG